MDILFVIASVAVTLFVVGEIAAVIYILRNCSTVSIRLRKFLGLELDFNYHASTASVLAERLETIDRKINYIGRHTKFERAQLRKMGLLKEVQPKAQIQQ